MHYNQYSTWRYIAYRDRDRIVSQHEQIKAAIENHDADKAVKVMVEQLDDLHEQMHKAHEWRIMRDKHLYKNKLI